MGRILAFDRATSPNAKKLWPFAESAAEVIVLICGLSLLKKINGFRIVRVEIATVACGSFAMTFEALAMMKKMYEDNYIFLTAMV